jgi:hypothetical protein
MARCIDWPHSDLIGFARFQLASWDTAAAVLAEAEIYFTARDSLCKQDEVRRRRFSCARNTDPNGVCEIIGVRSIILRNWKTRSDKHVFTALTRWLRSIESFE